MALSAFERAFAAARKDGESEFTFRGKRYNTRTAEEEAKLNTPAAGSGRGKEAGASAGDMRTMSESGKNQGRGASAGATDKDYQRAAGRKMFEKAGLMPSSERSMSGEEAAEKAVGVAAAAMPMAKIPSAAKASASAGMSALKEMTAGGPKAASKVTPSRPTANVGRKNDMPAEVRRSEEGFNPAEANRAIARKQAEAKVVKQSDAPAKPKATASSERPSPKAKTRYKEDEREVEFKKGGSVRGYGAARGTNKCKMY